VFASLCLLGLYQLRSMCKQNEVLLHSLLVAWLVKLAQG